MGLSKTYYSLSWRGTMVRGQRRSIPWHSRRWRSSRNGQYATTSKAPIKDHFSGHYGQLDDRANYPFIWWSHASKSSSLNRRRRHSHPVTIFVACKALEARTKSASNTQAVFNPEIFVREAANVLALMHCGLPVDAKKKVSAEGEPDKLGKF